MKQLLTTVAIKWLRKQLNEDNDYFMSWQASIAMSFQDTYYWMKDKNDIHTISNEAAKNFLTMFIN